MYPNEIIFGITLYDVFLCLGIISAVIVCDVFLSKRKVPEKVQSFYLISGGISAIAGIFGAELFQSFFNYLKFGEFELGGMTFYGGLIVGVATFFLAEFLVGGLFFKENEHKKYFGDLIEVSPCCITLAHALGRIGCLTAGCCHGGKTDGIFGVYMIVPDGEAGKYIPTQLYEAIFLLCLFFVLTYLFRKNKKINAVVYLLSYGAWRFFIEFFRADERGALLPYLTPAQAISLVLITVGFVLLALKRKKRG